MACGSTMNMRNFELRSMIKFLTKEIHEMMNAVYGDVSPSYYQAKFWSKIFKWGRESIEEDSCSDQPVESSSKKMCQKVEDMILQDHHVKINVIAHELGISAGKSFHIIHSVLMMLKVNSR